MKRYCIKCGAEINDDTQVFCLKCGTELAPLTEDDQRSDSLKGSGKSRKKRNYALKITAVLIILAAIGGGIFSFMGKRYTAIDMDKYISGTLDGFNGYGSVKFDRETFQKDILDMMVKNHTLQDNGDGMAWEAAGLAIDNCIDITVTYDEGKEDGQLANGDTFRVDYDFDEDWWKEHGIRLTGGGKTYAVSGLKDVEEIDVFENVEVSFEGMDGSGTAVLNTDTVEGLHISVNPDSELSNGDTVELALDYNGSHVWDEYMSDTGKIPKAFSKEVAVEKLEISQDEQLNEATKQTDDNTQNPDFEDSTGETTDDGINNETTNEWSFLLESITDESRGSVACNFDEASGTLTIGNDIGTFIESLNEWGTGDYNDPVLATIQLGTPCPETIFANCKEIRDGILKTLVYTASNGEEVRYDFHTDNSNRLINYNEVYYTYDDTGLLLQIYNNSDGKSIDFEYDPYGKIAITHMYGNCTYTGSFTVVYDELGRIIDNGIKNDAMGTTSFQYDANGNLSSVAINEMMAMYVGFEIQYSRLQTKSFVTNGYAGMTLHYQYTNLDDANRREEQTDTAPTGSWEYSSYIKEILNIPWSEAVTLYPREFNAAPAYACYKYDDNTYLYYEWDFRENDNMAIEDLYCIRTKAGLLYSDIQSEISVEELENNWKAEEVDGIIPANQFNLANMLQDSLRRVEGKMPGGEKIVIEVLSDPAGNDIISPDQSRAYYFTRERAEYYNN